MHCQKQSIDFIEHLNSRIKVHSKWGGGVYINPMNLIRTSGF